MGFLPFPCTLFSNSSTDHHQDSPPSPHHHHHLTTHDSESHSLSSQPSLPSVPSLTPNQQPPSTTANHHYVTTFKGHSSAVTSLSLAGKHLFSGSSDAQIRIWPQNPSPAAAPPCDGGAAVKSMVVNGDRVFTGHQDHKIRVWKMNEKQMVVRHVATLPTMTDRLAKMAFAENYVRIRRHRRRVTWVHHVDAVSALAVSKDGALLYSGSWDRSFKVWRTSDFRCLESVWNAHDDAINDVVVSHDGCVYTGSADRRIKVWRRGGGGGKKHTVVDTLEKHKSAVNALGLSADGSVLYSGACDRSIIVWEKVDGGDGGDGPRMVVAGALRGHSRAILCIAVVADVVFSGSADNTIRAWIRGINGKSYSCLGVFEGYKGPVKCLAAALEGCTSVNNDGGTSYLVYGGSLDGEIKMWKLWVPFV